METKDMGGIDIDLANRLYRRRKLIYKLVEDLFIYSLAVEFIYVNTMVEMMYMYEYETVMKEECKSVEEILSLPLSLLVRLIFSANFCTSQEAPLYPTIEVEQSFVYMYAK